MIVSIRSEREEDAAGIHSVIERAFLDAAHSDGNEPRIVLALREAGALTISLVAEDEGGVVGHVAISPVRLSDGARGWYGLGPVSVLPGFQGQGIGSRLIERALDELEASGAAGCVVLGEPDFYARFGFGVVDGLVLPEVPPGYFQARSFTGRFPRGKVRYHGAFEAGS